MDPDRQEKLRQLPKMDALLSDSRAETLIKAHSRSRFVEAARATLDAEREALLGANGAARDFSPEHLFEAITLRLASEQRPNLRRVINATGVVLHTNLGRAPLAGTAVEAILEIARSYSNLEYDLAVGRRGTRQAHVEPLLTRLTGAEAALVVNNNAAAVMLAVNTLARDGEVITSRGELIEIGGSFRIPDVIETSEARMVETGTTNRTRAADYAWAITPNTRILLKVHPSNYRIVGFTEAPSREELAALARERGLVAMEDLGSGTLIDLKAYGLPAEPTVQEALRAGMDLVTFSGDKLLGGPQAGIIVGRAEHIARMKQNPLYRALRVDKLTLAALEATLRVYIGGAALPERLPVLRLLTADPVKLRSCAKKLAQRLRALPGLSVESIETTSYAGGGSLPEEALPDWAVAIRREGQSADALHAALRAGDPAVVARVAEGAVLLQMRAVANDELRLIETAFARIVVP